MTNASVPYYIDHNREVTTWERPAICLRIVFWCPIATIVIKVRYGQVFGDSWTGEHGLDHLGVPSRSGPS